MSWVGPDASNLNDGIKRIKAFVETGVDAVVVEGLKNIKSIDRVCNAVPDTPVAVNSIFGGETPPISLSQLKEKGVMMAIYSTPFLFAAHSAIINTVDKLTERDGV